MVLREATTQALSPVMWISGSAAEPLGLARFRPLLNDAVARRLRRDAAGAARERRRICSCASAAGARDTIAGAPVYVTDDVGPAVVGLLRPRIVVPSG